jgi:hypothetical protein
MAQRIWMGTAGLLVAIAAIFLWRNNHSAAFVTGTAGAVAWFLSYRSQLQAKIAADQQYESPTEDADEN